jgi:hypothetical protein
VTTKLPVRRASPHDAHALWLLLQTLGQETRFLRLSPAEKQATACEFATKLAHGLGDPHLFILVGEIGDDLVGYLRAELVASERCVRSVGVGCWLNTGAAA